MSIILNTLDHGLVYLRRAATLQELKKLDDHLLQDMGFSRSLLNKGVTAWPWLEDASSRPIKANVKSKRDKKYVSKPIDASKVPHFYPAG